MARLVYRLADEQRGHPQLYHYSRITKDEIMLRFACDYYVKDGVVYEKSYCRTEPDGYVIYVEEAVEESAAQPEAASSSWRGIRVELRQYEEHASFSPLIRIFDYSEEETVLLLLLSDVCTVNGTVWEKVSTEIDEDRKLYVYYAREGEQHG